MADNQKLLNQIHTSSNFNKVLSLQQAQRYHQTTQVVLKDFTNLKNDSDYCSFVNAAVSFDLQTGFKNLEDISLLLDLSLDEKKGNSMGFGITQSQHYLLLHMRPDSLEDSDVVLRSAIAHEFGHGLDIAASYKEKNYRARFPKPDSTQPINQPLRWQCENDADVLTVATNFENDVGKMLKSSAKEHTWLNAAYQDKTISHKTAQKLAKFSVMRDELLLNTFDNSVVAINLLNLCFKMNCHPTHPSDIARAVAAEDFKGKAKNYQSHNLHQ